MILDTYCICICLNVHACVFVLEYVYNPPVSICHHPANELENEHASVFLLEYVYNPPVSLCHHPVYELDNVHTHQLAKTLQQ